MHFVVIKNNGIAKEKGIAKLAIFFLAVVLLSFSSGWFLGSDYWSYTAEYKRMQEQNKNSKIAVNDLYMQYSNLKRVTDAQVNTVAKEFASNQARLVKLEALGKSILAKANLPEAEYTFQSEAAVGGPSTAFSNVVNSEVSNASWLSENMESFKETLLAKESMFSSLSTYSDINAIDKADEPVDLFPVRWGWITSRYGWRVDPFSGNRSFHGGIDVAGVGGSEVVAVEKGVVIFSGVRKEFGKVVEIYHPGGYRTLYGHNEELLVRKGEIVEAGQAIGLLGSTGRSTGNHVHFAVYKNGKYIDPASIYKI